MRKGCETFAENSGKPRSQPYSQRVRLFRKSNFAHLKSSVSRQQKATPFSTAKATRKTAKSDRLSPHGRLRYTPTLLCRRGAWCSPAGRADERVDDGEPDGQTEPFIAYHWPAKEGSSHDNFRKRKVLSRYARYVELFAKFGDKLY